MPRRSARLLVLLTIFATPQAAFAEASGEIATRLFLRLDRDRSGVVTVEEFAFARNLDFQRLDRNADGYLGRDEFIEKRSPRNALSARTQRLRRLRIRRYAEIDSDRDGRIVRREYMAFGRRLFARLDSSGDGKLTLSEVRSRRTLKAPPAKARQAGGLFEQLDNNRNGAISLDELLSARRIVFRRLDTDKNGTINATEFAAREATIAASSGQVQPPRLALSGRASQRFLQLDRNNNGQISESEYLADGKLRFAAADRDRNGRLDRTEFEGGAGR